MTRHIFVLSLLAMACLAAAPLSHAQSDIITLTATGDIAEAMALHSRLEVMTVNILECTRQENGDAQHCACAFPEDLQGLKAAYDRTLEQHPDWENATLAFNTPSTNAAPQTTINFPNLREQFKTCPETP